MTPSPCVRRLERWDGSAEPPKVEDAIDWCEVRNLVDVAAMIVAAATARTETRGAHTREDFPDDGPRAPREVPPQRPDRYAFATMTEAQTPAANWYPDPGGKHEHRYWDGSQWTDNVADHGRQAVDPLVANHVPTTHHSAQNVQQQVQQRAGLQATGRRRGHVVHRARSSW